MQTTATIPGNKLIIGGIAPKKTLARRLNTGIKALAAILFTTAPILSVGLWIFTTYIYEPRPVRELAAISAPADANLWNEPLVSITFDDGWESVYSEAAPVLEKQQIPTTQYVLSGTLEDTAYLSEAQIRSLQKAGHDIQSHTVTHANLSTLSTAELEVETQKSRDDITKLTGTKVTDFASPLNSHTPASLEIIKKHYRSHRNTEPEITATREKDFNLRDTFNVYQIMAFSVDKSTTKAQIADYIAQAKRLNGWAVLVYHEVDAQSSSKYSVTPKQFAEHMQAVKDSQVKTVTVDKVLDTYEARNASHLQAKK